MALDRPSTVMTQTLGHWHVHDHRALKGQDPHGLLLHIAKIVIDLVAGLSRVLSLLVQSTLHDLVPQTNATSSR